MKDLIFLESNALLVPIIQSYLKTTSSDKTFANLDAHFYIVLT